MENGITHINQGFDIHLLIKEQLANMWEVYICPSWLCNLQCPHCTLRNLPSRMELANIEATLQYINDFGGEKVMYDLFGGEPLLLPVYQLHRLYDKIKQRPYRVSTNLLAYKQEDHDFLLLNADVVNTSWNPHRFATGFQYDTWFENLKTLQTKGVKTNLMVTLTQDFIHSISPYTFYSYLKILKPYSIDLDYVIGNDDSGDTPEQDFLGQIDNWLCRLYRLWDLTTVFDIVDNMKLALLGVEKYRDCSGHYTILPTGNIKPGCAYYEKDVNKSICLTCELYNICNGACRLQEKCTFPKKLFSLVKQDFERNKL